MIGHPTNFQHTGHIGSRDVEMPGDQLIALQNQMKSKGGYETTYKVLQNSSNISIKSICYIYIFCYF